MGLGLEFGGSRVRLGFWVWGSRVLNDLEFAAAGVSSQLQASDLVLGAQQGVKGGGGLGLGFEPTQVSQNFVEKISERPTETLSRNWRIRMASTALIEP